MLNTVQLQGNIVRDPEFADTRGDTDIINFTIAHSRKYKDKEDTTFVDCTAYGMTATNIGKFFSKGNPILVQGRLSQNVWEDRDGNKRSKIYITVDAFHFAGSTDDDGGGDSGRGGNRGGRGGNRGGRGGNRGNSRGGNRGNSRSHNRDDREGNRGRNERNDGGGQKEYDDDIPF